MSDHVGKVKSKSRNTNSSKPYERPKKSTDVGEAAENSQTQSTRMTASSNQRIETVTEASQQQEAESNILQTSFEISEEPGNDEVSFSSGSLQQATPSSEGEVPDTTTSSAPDFSFGTCPTEQESGVQTSTLSQAGKMKDSNGLGDDQQKLTFTFAKPHLATLRNNVSSAPAFPAFGEQPKQTFSFTKPALPTTTEAAPFTFGSITPTTRPPGDQRPVTTNTTTLLQPTSTAPGMFSFGTSTTTSSSLHSFGAHAAARTPITSTAPMKSSYEASVTTFTPFSYFSFGNRTAVSTPVTSTATGRLSFGAITTTTTSPPSLFSFGVRAGASMPVITPSTEAPQPSLFSFGTPVQQSATSPSFVPFSATPARSSETSFSFAAAPAFGATFSSSFGTVTPSSALVFGTPTGSLSQSLFGTSTPASTPLTSGFTFGVTPARQSTMSITSSVQFGSIPVNASESALSFGTSPGLSSSSVSFRFGTNSPSAAFQATSLQTAERLQFGNVPAANMGFSFNPNSSFAFTPSGRSRGRSDESNIFEGADTGGRHERGAVRLETPSASEESSPISSTDEGELFVGGEARNCRQSDAEPKE